MCRHTRFERTARADVHKSDILSHNISAIIVQGGKIVARAVNRRHRERSIHAEISALAQMLRRKRSTEHCDIHVYRFMADGSYGLAKPCSSCQVALKAAGIRRVWYSDYDGSMKLMRDFK